MDASTRWETEAIRSGTRARSVPPRPSSKTPPNPDAQWVTLKEAEAATGIPTNTLRKWVRKDTVTTYLESDGEMALRMVDLASVRARATELGRQIPQDTGRKTQDRPVQTSQARGHQSDADRSSTAAQAGEPTADALQRAEDATMLVPVDAWNKMLSQLGNLHEAGQQLADARERAAKAETEAAFLRERLREMRDGAVHGNKSDVTPQTSDHGQLTTEPSDGAPDRSSTMDRQSADDPPSGDPEPVRGADDTPATTSYWRYLTVGWRNRRKS